MRHDQTHKLADAAGIALIFALSTLCFSQPLVAEDAIPAIERRLPPVGKTLADGVRNGLEAKLAAVQKQSAKHANHRLAADIEIFTSAVELALAHDEFYRDGDAARAMSLLEDAETRLGDFEANQRPWTTEHGTLVRGYRSDVDGSVQPYGLVIPEKLDLTKPVPLYVWLHGRGDNKTNMAFLQERQAKVGQIAPNDAIVLHPFGRHCVGFKSAGEIDVLEAIEHVCANYNIDRRRIVLMGFSMGGAGCWHIGAHYADRFVAMSPGAGFAETAQYQGLKHDDVPWYEAKLWGLYDVPCYTRNLFNLPVVAYSGELDKQIQAARVMERAFAAQERTLTHLIGPGMGHKYHPDTLSDILTRMKTSRDAGLDTDPDHVELQTRTLRYNKMHWVAVMGLRTHWQDARVTGHRADDGMLELKTSNVTSLRLSPADARKITQIQIDGQKVKPFLQEIDGATTLSLVQHDGRWAGGRAERNTLAKVPGLQGPIDDAFMEPFLIVLPTGKCRHDAVERWVDFESQHCIDRWRALMRGAPRVKQDTEVTAEDIAQYNLILWGDAQSNAIIRRLSDWGPIRWGEDEIGVGEETFDARNHVPTYIYPNREALDRYIVINSGLTFREGHDRTNSLQNPKLPDWAIVDLSVPPDALSPGKIVAADFFDETWQLRAEGE